VIRPGELGLMTAGRGIAHAEHSPVPHPASLHGVQLWIALPDGARHTDPAWEFHASVPVVAQDGMTATVILGEFAGAAAPARATYSPIVGADITVSGGASPLLPLEADFEYAAIATSGTVTVDGVEISPGTMLYLGCGRRDLRLSSDADARLLLLGGEPFAEQIVMWWNFVARTGAEIAAAREEWMAGTDFGVVDDADPPLPAPELPPGTLKPGGSVRRRPGTRP